MNKKITINLKKNKFDELIAVFEYVCNVGNMLKKLDHKYNETVCYVVRNYGSVSDNVISEVNRVAEKHCKSNLVTDVSFQLPETLAIHLKDAFIASADIVEEWEYKMFTGCDWNERLELVMLLNNVESIKE